MDLLKLSLRNSKHQLWTGGCKKLPEEGGDSVLHLLWDCRADGEAETEGDQVDVGAQLVAQPSHLASIWIEADGYKFAPSRLL